MARESAAENDSSSGMPGAPADPADDAGLRVELKRLTGALEDIVALAHTSGDARQRMIQMERRAIAALSGADRGRATGAAEPAGEHSQRKER